MERVIAFISWCNSNSGFFSLLLSIIAIGISVLAISAQNKGVLFEKRVSIYYETYKMYKGIKRVIDEVNSSKSAANIIYLAAATIFEPESEESAIFQQLKKYDSDETKDDNTKNKIDEMISKYFDIYSKKYLISHLTEEAELLYGKDISYLIDNLYEAYDSLRMALIISTPDDISYWAKSAKKVVDDVDQKKLFSRMKKMLPLK